MPVTNYTTLRWLIALPSLLCATVSAEEVSRSVDAAPFLSRHSQSHAATLPSTETLALGPLYREILRPEHTIHTVGPLWVRRSEGEVTYHHVLYPLFTYRRDTLGASGNLFSLVRWKEGTNADQGEAREVWPFYFARTGATPEESYRAWFPFYGSVTQRFGDDRWTWVLFPLYSRSEKGELVIQRHPWPFWRTYRGGGHSGGELWPLYGQRKKEGDFQRGFAVWPFITWQQQSSEAGTSRTLAVLPFYAAQDAPHVTSRTWGWPFFGYTERRGPVAYRQTDYFWPLVVQGRGPQREVKRWAPFYTHSRTPDREKTWILWPLWKSQVTLLPTVREVEQTSFLFVFQNLRQESRTNPEAAPARRRHLWPLFSSWDDGRGRKQVQALSPIEPLFPRNAAMRTSWSHLFALYRLNQPVSGVQRHSLFWDLAVLSREPGRTAWNLGPLVAGETGARAKLTLGAGLIGLARNEAGRWRPVWCEFSSASHAARP